VVQISESQGKAATSLSADLKMRMAGLGRECANGDMLLADTTTLRFGLEPAALRVGIEDDAYPFNTLDALALKKRGGICGFPRLWLSG
jgi:hypothetical protein